MHTVDVSAIDLNLLVALDVLLQERNVTRAAKRLGRTQSAVSHALARLRDQLGDPILVRVGGEMRASPRAERLAGEVSRLLRALGRVLAQEGPFDPGTSDRGFTLAGPDFVAAILPTLLATLGVQAPRVGVELVPGTPGMFRDVADGRVDLVVAPGTGASIEGVCHEPLVTLDWAVYARRDHPAVKGWSAKTWASFAHIRVRTPGNAEGPVDRAARARRLTRRSGPYLPHFLLAPPLLARTDLLFTVPRAVLAEVAPRFGLVALPCPLKLPPLALKLFWSALLDRDPAVTWFRGWVRLAVAEAFGGASPRGRTQEPS
jgi:DNA-binding transcriptional LysR family regulator